jgi:gluconokinase
VTASGRLPGTAKVVLGVDLGTTATKVVAYDAAGGIWGEEAVAYPLDAPEPGCATQDPAVVVDAAFAAIRATAAAARERGAQIEGLCLSAALHSLVALDAHDRPLTPIVTWGDIRASEQAERLRAMDGDHALHRRTGTPLHAMSPLPKLVWFREHDPEVFAAASAWVGIKDLVLLRLCGERAVDHSVASATGLLGSATLDWDAEALELAGLHSGRLSRLVPVTEAMAGGLTGEAARGLELPAGTPVVIGGGDGPLANLGVGAVRPGVCACSIGTSGALRVTVERPSVDAEGRVFCYALTPGRWVVGGAINNGGHVLQWTNDALAPELGPHSEVELLELAARAPAGSDNLLMMPALLSERAPHWRGEPRGAYVGLTRAHRREHLVRAALEGVCLQLALVLRSMRDAGNEIREMRATGGFARSPLWRQLLTDAFGMPIGYPASREGSAFGAALVGMEALGMVDSVDVAADLIEMDDVTQPEPGAAAVYEAMLEPFSGLFDALTPTFEALRRIEPTLPE